MNDAQRSTTTDTEAAIAELIVHPESYMRVYGRYIAANFTGLTADFVRAELGRDTTEKDLMMGLIYAFSSTLASLHTSIHHKHGDCGIEDWCGNFLATIMRAGIKAIYEEGGA